jgi:hypothetical protein
MSSRYRPFFMHQRPPLGCPGGTNPAMFGCFFKPGRTVLAVLVRRFLPVWSITLWWKSYPAKKWSYGDLHHIGIWGSPISLKCARRAANYQIRRGAFNCILTDNNILFQSLMAAKLLISAWVRDSLSTVEVDNAGSIFDRSSAPHITSVPSVKIRLASNQVPRRFSSQEQNRHPF